MSLAADIVTGLIALLHVYILVMEMFLHDRAERVFAVPRDMRGNQLLRTLLTNQGIYNGFLAAGLFWGLVHPDPGIGLQVKLFFLGCVAVAGVVGAITAQGRILFVQTVPACLGIALLLLA